MSKQFLKYEEYSETLRLMPQNYMLANFSRRYWIVDPDAAVSEAFHIQLAKHFRKLENKFSLTSWKNIKLPIFAKTAV